MIDLRPAAHRTAALLAQVDDPKLALPTPCGPASVGDLVDHLGMFASNFTAVAGKELDESTSVPPPAFDVGNLAAGWRQRLAADLDALADAWSAEEAWEGSTWVGGMHLPAEVAGVIALDELIVHGWDLAVATAQPYDPSQAEVDAATAFVLAFDAPRDGRLFGPMVDVATSAPALDRLIGLTGRDPGWQPAV